MGDACTTLAGGCLESPWSTFYSPEIEFSSLSIMGPELWGEMCEAGLFLQGVDLFSLKFYPDRVVTINHSCHQKTRGTGLPAGEDCISLCVLSFWHITGVWRTDGRTVRQTDGRIRRSIYCACKVSFAARCNNSVLDTFAAAAAASRPTNTVLLYRHRWRHYHRHHWSVT